MSIPSKAIRFSLLLLVVLLGYAVRVHDLEGQSFWSDEGLSLYRAEQQAAELFKNSIVVDGVATRDTNPPFYFLLLHFSQALGGRSVFSLRYLGVAVAVLAVPIIYALGAVSFGHWAGIFAALFMAISPFHVWQSQVLRNYGLLVTLNLLSVYGLFRFILGNRQKRRYGWLALWAISGLLGIYTHYFGFFIFAFGGVVLILSMAQQYGLNRLLRSRWVWVGILIGLVVIVPAVIIALERFRSGQQVDFYRLPVTRILLHAASAFGVGIEPNLLHPAWRYVPVVLLAFVGVGFGWRWRRPATLLLLGYQIIPLGILLGLSYFNPLYNGTRHLLIGLPPFLIFIGLAISGPAQLLPKKYLNPFQRHWRWIGPVLGAVVLLSQLFWLADQFTAPELVRDDVRGAAEYLNAQAGPEDVIILHDTLIQFTFDYYYDGVAPVIAIPEYGNMDTDGALAALQAAVEGREQAWFLVQPRPRTGFDRQLLVDWANAHWPRFFNRSFPSMWLRVQLSGYTPAAAIDNIPDSAVPTQILWDGALQLHGHQIPDQAHSGREWWGTYYLSQPTSESEQHTLSLRLVDETGRVWSQMDEAITRGFPPSAGQADQIMRYDHRVVIPPGIPPGKYQLWLRLVRTADGVTLATSSGDIDVYLKDVAIEAAGCQDSNVGWPGTTDKVVRFGDDLSLQRYRLNEVSYRPGHEIGLDLWWCARQQPSDDYRIRVQLIDEDGQVLDESIQTMAGYNYPVPSWQAGELVMSKVAITVPADAKASSYDVQVSVLPADSDEALRSGILFGPRSIRLGTVSIEPWPMQTTLPAIPFPMRADFGQPVLIEFHGYGIGEGISATETRVNPGEDLDLTLYWRSMSDSIDGSYAVFVHMNDASENIVAQTDGVPAGGFRPTTSWRDGEVIIDQRVLSIPENVAAGTYDLWLGLYEPTSQGRLPIYLDGEQQPGDRLHIGLLTVNP